MNALQDVMDELKFNSVDHTYDKKIMHALISIPNNILS